MLYKKKGYYLNQLKTLVKRNLLLKKASKKSAIMEIALPIYCALMICKLFVIKYKFLYLKKKKIKNLKKIIKKKKKKKNYIYIYLSFINLNL